MENGPQDNEAHVICRWWIKTRKTSRMVLQAHKYKNKTVWKCTCTGLWQHMKTHTPTVSCITCTNRHTLSHTHTLASHPGHISVRETAWEEFFKGIRCSHSAINPLMQLQDDLQGMSYMPTCYRKTWTGLTLDKRSGAVSWKHRTWFNISSITWAHTASPDLLLSPPERVIGKHRKMKDEIRHRVLLLIPVNWFKRSKHSQKTFTRWIPNLLDLPSLADLSDLVFTLPL